MDAGLIFVQRRVTRPPLFTRNSAFCPFPVKIHNSAGLTRRKKGKKGKSYFVKKPRKEKETQHCAQRETTACLRECS